MRARIFALACLVVLSIACGVLTSPVLAGKYNPTLNIGDQPPAWKDLPGVDGEKHSLAEFADKEVLVVVFTCNTCPTAVDYEDRLMALTKQLSANSKCAVVAISSNKVAGDELPAMQERAKTRKFNFPYLRDDTQEVAKSYGATVTPEFFVLDKQRRVVYMGALDDSTEPAGVKLKYVEDAVGAVLAGKKPEVQETVGRGCLVRYGRDRKKK